MSTGDIGLNPGSLRKGWTSVRIGDLCDFDVESWSPRKEPKREFEYVDISSVDNSRKRILKTIHHNQETAPSRARQIILTNDCLVATTRPNLNAVALVPPNLNNQICSTGFCVLRPLENKLVPDYLFWYVQTDVFKKELSGLVRGALYPAVTDQQVRDQNIPIPSTLNDQEIIATKIRTQMSLIEKARSAVSDQITLCDSLAVSYITSTLNKASSARMELGDCLEEVTKGIGNEWNKYPLVGATRQGAAPAKEKISKHPQKYKLVESGTIYYNPMRILIGSIAFVDIDDVSGITSPDYVVFKTKKGIVDSRWFYYWMRSQYGAAYIRQMARGAVRERMLFNRLIQGTIEIPEYGVQEEASIGLLKIRPLVVKLEEQLTYLNSLPAKLLQNVFVQNA